MKSTIVALGIFFSLALSQAGCFSPERPGNLNCSIEGDCPSGMTCGSDNVCRTANASDANSGATIDARVLPDSRPFAVDAGIPIDATPVGCSSNADCLTPPDPCRLSGTCNLDTGTCSFPDVECASGNSCLNIACEPTSGECVAQNANEGTICLAEQCGNFGLCGGFDSGNSCDETGTRSRECSESICRSGSCDIDSRTDMMVCTDSTTGDECLGGTTCGAYGACGGFDSNNSCDETGTRTRTCTDRNCGSGNCAAVNRNEMGNCARDTDGDDCEQGTTCTAYGACSYDSDCDESGSRTRVCTDRVCSNGGCTELMRNETDPCSRSTTGNSCEGGTTCGGYGTCGSYDDTCDTTGRQSRACTDRVCASGTCNATNRNETRNCSRATEGNTCGFSNSCGFPGEPGFRPVCCSANETCTVTSAVCGLCEF